MTCAELAAWIEATGTWAEAIVASLALLVAFALLLFGERMWPPKVELSMHDPQGDLIERPPPKRLRRPRFYMKDSDGYHVVLAYPRQWAIYHHIRVTNKRRTTARRVRVRVIKLEKRTEDRTFLEVPLIIPVQLQWAYSFTLSQDRFPTIYRGDQYFCDLGFLDKDADRFWVTVYENPTNFQGYVSAGESLRVHLRASGENFRSKPPTVVEISWDGKWDDDPHAMTRHLVVRQVQVSAEK